MILCKRFGGAVPPTASTPEAQFPITRRGPLGFVDVENGNAIAALKRWGFQEVDAIPPEEEAPLVNQAPEGRAEMDAAMRTLEVLEEELNSGRWDHALDRLEAAEKERGGDAHLPVGGKALKPRQGAFDLIAARRDLITPSAPLPNTRGEGEEE